MDRKLTLYSIKCSKCSVLQRKMKAKGMEFTLIEGEDGSEGQKAIEELGFRSAPLLKIEENGGTIILTFDKANDWINNH